MPSASTILCGRAGQPERMRECNITLILNDYVVIPMSFNAFSVKILAVSRVIFAWLYFRG